MRKPTEAEASAGSPAYHVAKAGVIMLVRHVARAYGPRGIHCNALCPGLTDTPILDPFAAQMGGREALFTRTRVHPEWSGWRPGGHRGGRAFPHERRGVRT